MPKKDIRPTQRILIKRGVMGHKAGKEWVELIIEAKNLGIIHK